MARMAYSRSVGLGLLSTLFLVGHDNAWRVCFSLCRCYNATHIAARWGVKFELRPVFQGIATSVESRTSAAPHEFELRPVFQGIATGIFPDNLF